MAREQVKKWYNAHIGHLIPRYAVFSLISCFIFNSLVYSGTQWLMSGARHYDLSTAFDRWLPYRPQWVYIYLICFAFWGVNYILISRQGKEHWFRFAVADMISRVVCGILFIVIPTTTIRPIPVGNDLYCRLMRGVYCLDPPTNLFPSIHCLVSWFCYVGIRGNKNVKWGYRAFSYVFAILVFMSTQFTKQHYIVDIIAAILVAEGCYYFSHHINWYLKLEAFFKKIDRMFFGDNNDW